MFFYGVYITYNFLTKDIYLNSSVRKILRTFFTVFLQIFYAWRKNSLIK